MALAGEAEKSTCVPWDACSQRPRQSHVCPAFDSILTEEEEKEEGQQHYPVEPTPHR